MNKNCDTCMKSNVCKYRDEYLKAEKDIKNIAERENVFVDVDISCKNYF